MHLRPQLLPDARSLRVGEDRLQAFQRRPDPLGDASNEIVIRLRVLIFMQRLGRYSCCIGKLLKVYPERQAALVQPLLA